MDTRGYRAVLLAAVITSAYGMPLVRNWPSPTIPKRPQVSLFPPYPWHGVNWSSEENSIIWMDGLSGDGPVERFSNHPQNAKSFSSEAYFQTSTSMQSAYNSFEDFSIEILTSDTENSISEEEVVRSSFSFNGPSSLLNTFIFRPTTPSGPIKHTPTPSLSTIYTVDDVVNSYRWSSHKRPSESKQRESREVGQSERSNQISTTYIVTAISATHIYPWLSEVEIFEDASKSTVQESLAIENSPHLNTITNALFTSEMSSLIQSTPVISTQHILRSYSEYKEESRTNTDFNSYLLVSSFSAQYTGSGVTYRSDELSSTNSESIWYMTKTDLFSKIHGSISFTVENSYKTNKVESFISTTNISTIIQPLHSLIETETTNQFGVSIFNDNFTSKVPETTIQAITSMSKSVFYISSSFTPEYTQSWNTDSLTLVTEKALQSQSLLNISSNSASWESNTISETKMELSMSDEDVYTYIETSPTLEDALFSTSTIESNSMSKEPSPISSDTSNYHLNSFVTSEVYVSISDNNFNTYSLPLEINFSTFVNPTAVDYYFTSDVDSIFIYSSSSVESTILSSQPKNTLMTRSVREISETDISVIFSSDMVSTHSLEETESGNFSISSSYSSLYYSSSTTLVSLEPVNEINSPNHGLSNTNYNSATELFTSQSYATSIESSIPISSFASNSELKQRMTVHSDQYSDGNTDFFSKSNENMDQTREFNISSDSFVETFSSLQSPTVETNAPINERFTLDLVTSKFSDIPLVTSLEYNGTLLKVTSLNWSLISEDNSTSELPSSSGFGSPQMSLTEELYGTELYPYNSSFFYKSFEKTTMIQEYSDSNSILTFSSNVVSTISEIIISTRQALLETSTEFGYSFPTIDPSIETDDITPKEFTINNISPSISPDYTKSVKFTTQAHLSLYSPSIYITSPSASLNMPLAHQSPTIRTYPEFTQSLSPLLSQLPGSSEIISPTQVHTATINKDSEIVETENIFGTRELNFATSNSKVSNIINPLSTSKRNSLYSGSLVSDQLSSSFEKPLYSNSIYDITMKYHSSSPQLLSDDFPISRTNQFPESSLSAFNLHSPTIFSITSPLTAHSALELSSSMATPHPSSKIHGTEKTFRTIQSHYSITSRPLSCNLPPVLQITSSYLSDFSHHFIKISANESNHATHSLHSSLITNSYTYNWSNSFILSNTKSDFSSIQPLDSHSPHQSNILLLSSSFTTFKSMALSFPFTPSLDIVRSENMLDKSSSQLKTPDSTPHPSATLLGSLSPTAYPYDPTEYEESTTPSGTLQKSLMDKNYWILTVLEAPVGNELPENFSHTMELRLANAYSEAYRSYRSKREDSILNRLEFVIVKILSLTNNLLLNQLEILYVVERGGELVPAQTAADTLDVLRHDQLRGYLGHNVIIKATPYEPGKRATIVEQTSSTPTSIIVGSIIGALLALLLIICIYFRCCHTKTVVASATSSTSGSLQRSLSTYGQHNRKQIFQEATHYIGSEGEGHPEKGQIGPPVKPISSNIPISGRHLPKLPQIPPEHPKEQPSSAKKEPQRIDVGTLTVPVETKKSKTDLNGAKKREKSAKPSRSKERLSLRGNGMSSESSKFIPRPVSEENQKSEDSLLNTSASNGSSSPISSKTDTESASDGSNAALLPTTRNHMADKDEGEAQVAATQLHLSKVRQRISELLDDAFAMAGAQRVGTSLRNKRINPSSDTFPRFSSLRSPQRSHSEMAQRYALSESEKQLLGSNHRPSSTGGKQQLIGALTDDGKLEILPVPKVVWSKGSSGEETEDAKSLNSETLDARMSSGHSRRGSSGARSGTFRPSSSLPVLDALDELSTELFTSSRTLHGAASAHQLPYSSRMNPAALVQYDELDVIDALKEGEPIAAIIQAIKDELQKFNNSLPGTNSNESTA